MDSSPRGKSQTTTIRTVTRYKEELLLSKRTAQDGNRSPEMVVESPSWRFSKLDYPKPWPGWYSSEADLHKAVRLDQRPWEVPSVCSVTGFPESFKTLMWMTSKNLMCVLFGCWMGFLIKTQFELIFYLEQVYLCKHCSKFLQFWKRKKPKF